jgi:hypothetical protein
MIDLSLYIDNLLQGGKDFKEGCGNREIGRKLLEVMFLFNKYVGFILY